MWLSLRSGFANTAAIAALALLPLISVASAMLKNGSGESRLSNDPVKVEQVVLQADSLLAHLAE
jgi:hypothetical protein